MPKMESRYSDIVTLTNGEMTHVMADNLKLRYDKFKELENPSHIEILRSDFIIILLSGKQADRRMDKDKAQPAALPKVTKLKKIICERDHGIRTKGKC